MGHNRKEKAVSVKNPFMNLVVIQGRMTRDPELKFTSQGKAICSFSIANTKYFSRNGERAEKTGFFDVIVWDKVAEYVGQNLHKGDDVQIEGELEQESWEDKNTGQKRSKVRILARRVAGMAWPDDTRKPEGSYGREKDLHTDPIPEDDIPF